MSAEIVVTDEFVDALANLGEALPNNSVVKFLAQAKVGDYIFTQKAPPPWHGGHCKYRGLNHEDCPGHLGNRPCICACHRKPPISASKSPLGVPEETKQKDADQ